MLTAFAMLPSSLSDIKTTYPMTTTTNSTGAPPAVGSIAPDFVLPSTSGERVTLSQLRGHNVLIAFFPLAFSSTCTAELCEMRDDWDQFATRDLTVLPISVDSTYSLKEYKQKYSMKVDLLSDFKREVSVRYGVLNEDRFFSNRAYFLIDKQGVIRWAHVEENPSLKRTNQELLEQVDRLT
jgi:peroxiredoxin